MTWIGLGARHRLGPGDDPVKLREQLRAATHDAAVEQDRRVQVEAQLAAMRRAHAELLAELDGYRWTVACDPAELVARVHRLTVEMEACGVLLRDLKEVFRAGQFAQRIATRVAAIDHLSRMTDRGGI